MRNNRELLAESGTERRYAPVPTQANDARKFERFYFRTLATATIHPVPVLGLETQECYVLTRDISRGGVSFLHPKKLAVGQRIELAFQDGKELAIHVQRVRQLAPRCYLIGCRLAAAPNSGDKQRLAALNPKRP
ncbi:MAG: PilZ domain-containing protein, partial [Planctomycetia bacterium]|nr:PilZ domain-containing protein [Planctomycetia bacterium]